MQQTKICLIGNSLSGGGADKIHAILSNYFFEQKFVVQNVILSDEVTYKFSGALLNLGINAPKRTFLSSVKKAILLKRLLKKQRFDFIIDFRTRDNWYKELLYARLLYKTSYILTVHSYNLNWYFPKNNFLCKAIYANAYGIIAVSAAIEKQIRHLYAFKNLQTIYNPIDINCISELKSEAIALDFDFVIAAGRMVADNNKQFDKLIEAYTKSILPKNNIKLVFLGEGNQKEYLKQLAKDKNQSENIVFLGFQNNPFAYFSKAQFLVLTSKFEGLPNTIIESLACGTPVVAFDCQSGPSELIENKKNGLLIENQNFEKLVLGMNEMIENPILHAICKSNAAASVSQFYLENIGKQWLDFLKLKQN